MDKGGSREELLVAPEALVLPEASGTGEHQRSRTGEGWAPRLPWVALGPSSVGIPGP